MSNHEVSWGKVIAGATIASAALAVATFALPTLATVAAAHVGTGIGGWIASQVVNAAVWTLGHVGTSQGIAMLAGGAAADIADRISEHKEEKRQQAVQRMEDQSFAMREDMRRMQALMQIRMQAAGIGGMPEPGRG